MATGKTDIYALAALRLGGGNTYDVITESVVGANTEKMVRVFDSVWDLSLKYVLSLENWASATKYETCGAYLTGAGLPGKSDWDYAYNKPPDCVRVIDLIDEDDRSVSYPYEEAGQYILMDEDEAYAKYVWLVGDEDLPRLDGSLTLAIAGWLAYVASKSLGKPESERALLLQEYERDLNTACRKNGMKSSKTTGRAMASETT